MVRNGREGALYINSELDKVGSSTLSNPVAIVNSDFTLGKNLREDNSYLSGTMDHIEVYSSALTQFQVSNIYNQYKGA